MRLRGEMIAEQFRHAPAPMPRSLLDDFLDQARRRPGRLAVVDSRVRWSYLELFENSARVAAFLLHHQPAGNRRVLVFAGKSTFSAAAILGTWMAGWAYGCIDEGYPLALAQGACDIIKPDLILVANEHGEFDPELIRSTAQDLSIVHVAEVVAGTLGAERAVIENGCADRGRGEDIAYFGFTSGTTGRPKTIAMSHRGFLHSIDRHLADFGFDDRDRVAVQSCFAFDPAVMDLLSALNVGGVAIMVPTDLYCDGRAWNLYLSRHHVSSLMCVPGALEIGLDCGQHKDRFASLRQIIFTGDRVSPNLMGLMRRCIDNSVLLHNAFGLTEVPYLLRGSIDFAKPASALQFHYPVRASGIELNLREGDKYAELVVRGAALFSGYLQEQNATLPRTRPMRFSTGDHFLAEKSHLVYHGRLDGRMKWWGHRLEPAEVEMNLVNEFGVRDATLTIDTDGSLLCQFSCELAREVDIPAMRALILQLLPNAIASNIRLQQVPKFDRKRAT